MAAKQVVFGDDARGRILRGVDILAAAVRLTLGPRGRTVILERDFGAPQIVNSGVLVARSVELEVVEGLQFDRGFLSPYFINDAERRAVVFEDAAEY